jgi:hypothetical protein
MPKDETRPDMLSEREIEDLRRVKREQSDYGARHFAHLRTKPAPKEKEGRSDTVRPPASLPDTSPLDRMTELTRRVVGVPKDEAIPPKREQRRV